MTFAITLVPVMTLVGVAVDYGSLVRTKTSLQSEVDAVVLGAQQQNNSGSGSSRNIDSNAKLLTYAQQFVPATSATYDATDGTMCVTAQRSVNTSFLRVARINSMSANATACSVNQSQAGSQDTFEIALALDNTGSMAIADWKTGKTKIASEITAAKNFVTQMFDAVPEANMQISVVPFSTAVNVGTANQNASWMDKLGKSSIHWENFPKLGTSKEDSWNPQSRFDLFSQIKQAWGGCVEERPQPFTLSDDAPTSGKPDTLFVPLFAPDESDKPNDGYTAFGYYKNDRLGTMTVNRSAQKISGANQRSFLDAAFLQACANAKDAGVEIYTVAFSIPNDPIDSQGQSVMKSCATNASHYYLATDGTELDKFFKNIGQSVTQNYLRLKS